MKIRKILILVELENGAAHQVLSTKERKELALKVLETDKGVLHLSEQVEPIALEPTQHNLKHTDRDQLKNYEKPRNRN